MPPFWKIARELKRLGADVADLPGYAFRSLVATPYYDHVLARQRKSVPGDLPLGRRVAIYLIYPTAALMPSHIRAIEHLVAHGYSPLVVANYPLSPRDRAWLRPVAFRLIERANYGYDFGGYRDGVLSIAGELAGLERLVLVNDSTWFPLPGTEDWLAASEALGVDFAGAIWTGAVDRAAPQNFERMEWNVDKRRRNFHYASFALNIAAPILQDPAFLDFWKSFRLAQDKNRTVRRGEIGLTSWVMSRGYSHGATTELEDFGPVLSAMADEDFRALADRLIIFDDAELTQVARDIAARRPGDRRLLEKLVLTAVARRGASYALADYLVRELGFGFLKKAPALQTAEGARIIRDLAETLPGPVGPEIQAEIDRRGKGAAAPMPTRGQDQSLPAA